MLLHCIVVWIVYLFVRSNISPAASKQELKANEVWGRRLSACSLSAGSAEWQFIRLSDFDLYCSKEKERKTDDDDDDEQDRASSFAFCLYTETPVVKPGPHLLSMYFSNSADVWYE